MAPNTFRRGMAAPDLSEGKHYSRKVAKNAKKNAYFRMLFGLCGRHKAGISLGKPGGATDQAGDFGQ